MTHLRSYVAGQFVAGQAPVSPLHDPATEEVLAHTSTNGIDFAAALRHARAADALRPLSFARRGEYLLAASQALHKHREELITLAIHNGGNTRGDAKFDIDGAIGTLAAYAELGQSLGDARYLRDGEGVAPTRSAKLFGEHLWLPRQGVALHINAFNFPAWGMCEKAAVAWLCGLPVLSKPATSTALVAHRITEILIGALPPGVLSFFAGSLGDLIDHLGPQDVIAFTGSSDTAALLRRHQAVVERGVRLNVEADSLNVALLGPDAQEGAEAYDMFIADVVRDITQKAGQKCTAIRRVLCPEERLGAIGEAIADRLAAARVGNPADDAVTMGPVSTAAQLQSVRQGIGLLEAAPGVRRLCGGPDPLDGHSAPSGRGYFVRPTLLAAQEPDRADAVHQHEVFGPVATLLPYKETAHVIELVRRGGGGLVASVYSDDRRFVPEVVLGIGAHHGRIFLGGARLGQSPGPGTVLPLLNHGGPGRAGDGHELGGVRGMHLYMQRCAVMGYRPVVEALVPAPRNP